MWTVYEGSVLYYADVKQRLRSNFVHTIFHHRMHCAKWLLSTVVSMSWEVMKILEHF